MSGEGGDELFGGHPVYVADKLATVVDWCPQMLWQPLARGLQHLPDSDQKLNIQVKLKRFAYSLAFPANLLSHRWRTYYTAAELQMLCTDDFLQVCDLSQMFDSMTRYSAEADGRDLLSRSLYSDFHTIVNFYARRLGLLRAFGIHNRLPLLDYRLADYAARIPSQLKIKGLNQSKYLYRKVLEAHVPRSILYDRPKLGHGVPMKNWLRDNAEASTFLEDILRGSSLRASGFFRMDAVERMLDAHRRKTHNHSHRLWGLLVLALWLQAQDV